MIVNHMAREISAVIAFIAFIGPAGSGRRTVMGDFRHLAPPRGKVTWTESRQEALLAGAEWFDFVPPDLGRLDGHTIRVHLEMPPDPLRSPTIFEDTVKTADAVIFVADSRRAAMDDNLVAIRALARSIDRTRVPVVFFFNKRDLPDVVPVAELDAALGVNGAPSFCGNATQKEGIRAVKAALRAAIVRHQGKPFW
jgi:signal recognition particle receptor subunit beta